MGRVPLRRRRPESWGRDSVGDVRRDRPRLEPEGQGREPQAREDPEAFRVTRKDISTFWHVVRTRMIPRLFELYSPTTVTEAVFLLKKLKDSKILAGYQG